MFQGRRLVIATKHHKEKVIAPLFERAFGLDCFTPQNFDTDLLGTFTGEIERKDDPIKTLRNKCLQAMGLSNCDLGIASEGSFGSHPYIPFAHADDEFLMFIDKKNNLEVIERELSTRTNFNGSKIKSLEELLEFAKSALFPSHGLILRKSNGFIEDIYKGITTEKDLKNAFTALMDKYGNVYAETDMRALYNPTRMEVIETAVQKLITKIKTHCPKCDTPGFSIIEAKPGLKCETCLLPTRSTLLHILSCQSCGFTEEKMHPHGRFFEDPMYCDICNP